MGSQQGRELDLEGGGGKQAAAAAPPSGPSLNGSDDSSSGNSGSDTHQQQKQQHEERPYWEEAIFKGHRVADHCRRGITCQGAWTHRGVSKLPLLLAAVHGIDAQGHPFRWLARRHRKRVCHPHECPSPPPPIAWLAWCNVRAHAHKLGWWIALAFTCGSLLFVISGIAGEVTAVGNPAREPPGLTSATAALVAWPNVFAANLFFFSGGIMQMHETVQMDYDGHLRAWRKGGCQGRRPRRRLMLPSVRDMRAVSWWAVIIQVTGMLGFNIATLTYLISTTRELQPSVEDWAINFGFTYGGAAFTVSAVLMCFEATGSWWRGLVPTRMADVRSISWHSVFWNFHGAVGFLIGGAAGYATSFSWSQKQWILGYGNVAGALWFLLSALAMLLEQANPQHL